MIRKQSGKVTRSKFLRVIAGLAILAVLIFSVDSDVLVSQLTHLRSEHLFYAAMCIVIATLLGGFNAYLVVAIDAAVSFRKFLSFYWFSWALGLVVPGQVGDVASLTYLMQRAKIEWSRVLARAVLDKFISFVVMALLAGIALLTFSREIEIEFGTLVLTAAAVFTLVAIILYFVRDILLRNAKYAAWLEKIRGSFQDLSTFVSEKPWLVGINFVGTALKILLIGTAYWYVFQAGGVQDPPWMEIVLLVTVSSLVAYIPISFNGLGTVEVTGILLFSILGFSEELVLSSYLVLRVTVLIIAWVPSLLILLVSGKSGR